MSGQVILQADKTSNNFSDRAILKNLGHWLGLQTLGKNKPILQKVSKVTPQLYVVHSVMSHHQNLALKDLVLEACEKGQQVSGNSCPSK